MARVILLSAFFFVSVIVPAWACSCVPYESAKAQVLDTDVIFEGVSKGTSQKGFLWWKSDQQKTTFLITRSIKGIDADEIKVLHTDVDICCICGVSFTKGEEYLILAHRGEDGVLHTSSCSFIQHPREEYEEVFVSLND